MTNQDDDDACRALVRGFGRNCSELLTRVRGFLPPRLLFRCAGVRLSHGRWTWSPLGNPGARSMAQGEAADAERFQSHCDWIAAVRAEYERQVRAAGEASLDRRRHGAWSASAHCAPR